MNLVFTNKIDGIDLERLMDIYEEFIGRTYLW